MTRWASLTEELGRWHAAGKVATFWWRDDDLNEPTATFDRLLHLRQTLDTPLCDQRL